MVAGNDPSLPGVLTPMTVTTASLPRGCVSHDYRRLTGGASILSSGCQQERLNDPMTTR